MINPPKHRPILFNAEMVRAVLDGRKTQTRRIIKPQPTTSFSTPDGDVWNWDFKFKDFIGAQGTDIKCQFPKTAAYHCPYGQPGDHLWVRETFGSQVRRYGGGTGRHTIYKADNAEAVDFTDSAGKQYPVKWTPSIHMPRWASRITVEITDIRVERLQDISVDDARAEGCPDHDKNTPLTWFSLLWQSINGADSWDNNPWVWVIEFKRLKGCA